MLTKSDLKEIKKVVEEVVEEKTEVKFKRYTNLILVKLDKVLGITKIIKEEQRNYFKIFRFTDLAVFSKINVTG
jgi:hypothetical protein